MGKKRILTEEEKKNRQLEACRRYYERHKETKKLKNKIYKTTAIGRASYLLQAYNQSDRKYNRGKGDLTAKWIYDNILFKPCAHCGKEGWDIIGCNRLDNSKPHTMDNVEPCCLTCNLKCQHEKWKP